MNKQISKLITQAGGHWNHGDFNMPSSVEFQEQDIEKFAQLIVRECIAHVGEFTGEQNVEPVVLTDGTRGYDYDIVSAEEVLRKHFGLE